MKRGDVPALRVTIDPTEKNGLRVRSQGMADKSVTVRRERIGQLLGRLDDKDLKIGGCRIGCSQDKSLDTSKHDPQSNSRERCPTRRSCYESGDVNSINPYGWGIDLRFCGVVKGKNRQSIEFEAATQDEAISKAWDSFAALKDKVDIWSSEIPVSQCVAHFVGVQKREIRMGRSKLRTIAVNVSTGLTDDLEIADYCVLRKLAREKGVLGHIRRIAFNPFNGLKDVIQVIDSTKRLIDHKALHRTRFGEYCVSDIFGKRFRRQHVNRDTQ